MTHSEPTANAAKVNIWDYKPWWCQPWSILLTGIGLIGGSWLLLKTVWITALVALPISAWMGFFLLVYPGLFERSLQSAPSIASEDLAGRDEGSGGRSPEV